MSKLTFPLILILLVIWLVVATWWFNSKYNQLDTYGNSECEIPFIVSDGNFQTKSDNSIIFELSNWEPTIPMQALSSLKSVALYLANNHKKKLVLKGWFGMDELNDSDFPNAGIARAEAIKKELISYGAPDKLIRVEADSLENIKLTCGKIMSGIDFTFEKNPAIAQNEPKTELTESTKNDITPNPNEEGGLTIKTESDFQPEKTYIVFYNENTFKPAVNEEIDSYLKSLSEHLKEHPKDRLLLMGHTDNIGDKNKHFNFGKYRARKLRDVLLEYGIEKRRIKTDSKGSSKPLGSNSTSEGRYQNRRVEISIIQR